MLAQLGPASEFSYMFATPAAACRNFCGSTPRNILELVTLNNETLNLQQLYILTEKYPAY